MATTALLLPPLCFREEDSNGQPLAFGTVQSFQAGTVTPVATYTDSTGGMPNSNPLTLNNRGEANIWLLPNVGYKFLVKDAAGNQVRVTDNVQISQLLTLYGGVDSGIVNAYVLNFTANFSAYADGIVIYWIPANTNIGPSTINVNGLGVVAIVNAAGTPLVASQIIQNQPSTIIFKGGSFILVPSGQLGDGTLGPVTYGTWTPVWSGFSVAPTGNVSWVQVGRLITLQFLANCTGTSNATSFSVTNVPSNLRPASTTDPIMPYFCARDNGVITIATARRSGASTFDFFKGTSPPDIAGWTNAGSKGFTTGTVIVYSL